MSNISYESQLPIPAIFYENGILDPSNKDYKNRLCFIYWAMGRCYDFETIQNGIKYEAYEFSYIPSKSNESGLTADEMKAEIKFLVNCGFLIEQDNSTKNRVNQYKWDVSKFFDEKVEGGIENV